MRDNRQYFVAALALAVLASSAQAGAGKAYIRPDGGNSATTPKARASSRVVLRDCGAYGTSRPIVVRPRHIACGAVGAPDFTKLHWSRWGRGVTSARGTVTYRDCPGVPGTGCADPVNYHDVRVRLRVFRIRDCDGHRAYTKLRASFHDTDGKRDGYHLDLTLNWGSCS